jgi:hypothetical protein
MGKGAGGKSVVEPKIFDSMSYLVANIPPVEVMVDKRFLYDFEKDEYGKYMGEGEWERGHWVSVKSIPNRALLFETYIDKFGAVYDKLPLHAFRWRLPKSNDKIYPLDFLQLWDCLSYNISIIEKRILGGCKTFTTMKDGTIEEGEYLFTIDTAHSEPNEIDTGWSETPNEHKSYNISKMDNGQFCAQPNNRTRWYQPSRTADITQIPYFRYSTKIWRSEDYSKWRPSETNWDYTN